MKQVNTTAKEFPYLRLCHLVIEQDPSAPPWNGGDERWNSKLEFEADTSRFANELQRWCARSCLRTQRVSPKRTKSVPIEGDTNCDHSLKQSLQRLAYRSVCQRRF